MRVNNPTGTSVSMMIFHLEMILFILEHFGINTDYTKDWEQPDTRYQINTKIVCFIVMIK